MRVVAVIFSLLAFAATPWAGAETELDDRIFSPQRSENHMIILTVDKKALKAELRTLPEDPRWGQVLHSFRIAIGKANGDKQSEGDNRTPEGIYITQSQIDGSVLPEKYGPRAIPINFPNPIDQLMGKTGHGIWLHGVDNDQRIEEARVTEGCVAFYNPDIKKLSQWLRPRQGIVVIADDVTQVNQPLHVDAVTWQTKSWMRAWQTRNIEEYIRYYDKEFRYNRHGLTSYKRHKRRIFNSYRKIQLSFDSLRVVTHPKYAVTIMNQDFKGDDHFVSNGRKILYWTLDAENRWRIKREVFERQKVKFHHYTEKELALLTSGTSSTRSDSSDKKSSSL